MRGHRLDGLLLDVAQFPGEARGDLGVFGQVAADGERAARGGDQLGGLVGETARSFSQSGSVASKLQMSRGVFQVEKRWFCLR